MLTESFGFHLFQLYFGTRFVNPRVNEEHLAFYGPNLEILPFDSNNWIPRTIVIGRIWSEESYSEKFRPLYLLRKLATQIQILFTGSEILVIL